MAKRDIFNKNWILEKGIPIVNTYNGNLTLRALHYRLVAAGMTNSMRHYKRVISAMTFARWEGMVDFDDFKDHDRDVLGETKRRKTTVEGEVATSIQAVNHWLVTYRKNRWENQPIYPEVFIEKKALQGVFDAPCEEWDVALCPCKGYPSLTYLYDAYQRFSKAIQMGKKPIILYFGDYDPSGEDIPRSLQENLEKMGVYVEVRRIALMEHQVIEMNLPPAPAKTGDSRTANWDGLGQVELDAIEPSQLVEMANQAIESVFDADLYEELYEKEKKERAVYISRMREEVEKIFDEE